MQVALWHSDCATTNGCTVDASNSNFMMSSEVTQDKNGFACCSRAGAGVFQLLQIVETKLTGLALHAL